MSSGALNSTHYSLSTIFGLAIKKFMRLATCPVGRVNGMIQRFAWDLICL